MNILIISNYSNILGGNQEFVRRLRKYMIAEGHVVNIISDNRSLKSSQIVKEEGSSIYYFNWRNIFTLIFNSKINIIYTIDAYKKYMFLCFLFRIFVKNVFSILIFSGSNSIRRPGTIRKTIVKTKLIHFIYNKYVAISEYMAKNALGGTIHDRIKVIYHDVSRDKYKKTNFSRYNLLNIGRFCNIKNYEDLIKVFACVHEKNKDVMLDLVAGLEAQHRYYYNNIVSIINSCGLEKFVNIYINSENVIKMGLLSNSTLYITTSKQETFGIATLEALISGIPVIAFANTATEELCKKYGQILIKNGEVLEMAEKILDILNNKDEICKYSQLALKNAEISKGNDCLEYLNLFTEKV